MAIEERLQGPTPSGATLDTKLGAAPADPKHDKRLTGLEEMIAEREALKEKGPDGFMDKLLDPRMLAIIAASAAGVASGNSKFMQVGGLLGKQGVESLMHAPEQGQEKFDQRINELDAKILAQRKLLGDTATNRPEQLGDLDPERLGKAMGFGFAVDPQATIARSRETEFTQRQYQFGYDIFSTARDAGNKAGMELGLQQIERASGVELTPHKRAQIIDTMGAGEGYWQAVRELYDPTSMGEARKFMVESGLSPLHRDVQAMLVPVSPELDSLVDSYDDFDKRDAYIAMQEYTAWASQEAIQAQYLNDPVGAFNFYFGTSENAHKKAQVQKVYPWLTQRGDKLEDEKVGALLKAYGDTLGMGPLLHGALELDPNNPADVQELANIMHRTATSADLLANQAQGVVGTSWKFAEQDRVANLLRGAELPSGGVVSTEQAEAMAPVVVERSVREAQADGHDDFSALPAEVQQEYHRTSAAREAETWKNALMPDRNKVTADYQGEYIQVGAREATGKPWIQRLFAGNETKDGYLSTPEGNFYKKVERTGYTAQQLESFSNRKHTAQEQEALDTFSAAHNKYTTLEKRRMWQARSLSLTDGRRIPASDPALAEAIAEAKAAAEAARVALMDMVSSEPTDEEQ